MYGFCDTLLQLGPRCAQSDSVIRRPNFTLLIVQHDSRLRFGSIVACAALQQQLRDTSSMDQSNDNITRDSARAHLNCRLLCTSLQFEKYLCSWPFAGGWNGGVCGLIFDLAQGTSPVPTFADGSKSTALEPEVAENEAGGLMRKRVRV